MSEEPPSCRISPRSIFSSLVSPPPPRYAAPHSEIAEACEHSPIVSLMPSSATPSSSSPHDHRRCHRLRKITHPPSRQMNHRRLACQLITQENELTKTAHIAITTPAYGSDSNSERTIVRERTGMENRRTNQPAARSPQIDRLPHIPRPGGGGLFEASRLERAGRRGSGER